MVPSLKVADLMSMATLTEQAPAREPEVWDERIPAFSPLFAHTPEVPPVATLPEFAESDFDIGHYLSDEREKDLLRFSTAGSVDDGKSTLIGRLLYDTQNVYDDQLRSIEGKGTTTPGVLDLALLTDGLRAEREQGITIDVAYRYFSTAGRKFILADTPGHEQYTRNMATGTSTADVAIVLIDARKGVLPQTRRHAYITALLGVRHIIVAVNKMDLVGYAEDVFRKIEDAFRQFFAGLGVDGSEQIALHFVPVSALAGDNVAHKSTSMPWYTGPTLLQLLESLPSAGYAPAAPFRMAVQRVIRPDLDFRGFAGQIAAGTVRPGDRIVALPSGVSSRVGRIVTFNGDFNQASAPQSVILTLQDEIDISRGDLLASPNDAATVATRFTASLVWMEAAALDLRRRYLLKHMSRTVKARVDLVLHRVDLQDLRELEEAEHATLVLNGIGLVEIETLLPLAVDRYTQNRHTGSFVLIDPETNATVAAGMIRQIISPAASAATASETVLQVTQADRVARFGHVGVHVSLYGPAVFAVALERALFDRGANVIVASSANAPALVQAGMLVLTCEQNAKRMGLWATVAGMATCMGNQDDVDGAVIATLRTLRDAAVLHEPEKKEIP